MIVRLLKSLSLALALVFLSHSAIAQTYPNRPVRLVVAFPAGGPTDIVARLVADQLSKTWGQPVIVDNRSGASGMIGAEFAAKSAPDGYTIFMGTLVNNVMAHLLFAKVPFAPDAFAPVTLLTTTSNMLLVNASIPAATLQELVAYAKANPGKVSYSSAGVGLSGHLGMELFASAAGLDLLHVPFRGSAPATQAFQGGQVNLTLELVPSAVTAVKTAGVKPLAVAAVSRVRQFPDVPTFVELGYKNVQAYTWNGLMVPSGTPREVIDTIQRAARAALNASAVRERLNGLGVDAIGGTAEEFAELIRTERERWGPVIKRANIRAN
ncbi:MAG: tripartite tricarboxylate transporter substrate binding protein [Betaproteobacteria bacterium]|nr:tripartite tricarboxylate transporter substrate binding protein [Betaproteobacteria bacterium]